ncbi:hypothetical protein GDO86_009028 [Hymenochirus boettgeri]|uniref:Uncharacterized protein n=1 Tax=Hymenochirus boettgeri TaxID=247094 RepID=A0A8T2JMH3_9PIPI|nr:hypothetical protein GDO86_009028 [Hymenochirus boettgeri]
MPHPYLPEWWPRSEQTVDLCRPPYDTKTTQRCDFQKTSNSTPYQTRYGAKPFKSPVHGIVPLASPKTKTHLPKLLLEQISFLHKYDARTTPSEPIRGKRHGAFVWTEIKTESRPAVPQGTRLFPSPTGSRSLDRPQAERGNSVERNMTSSSSQQMFNSQTHLSKPDPGEGAKTFPSAAQTYPSAAQTYPSADQTGQKNRTNQANSLHSVEPKTSVQPSEISM